MKSLLLSLLMILMVASVGNAKTVDLAWDASPDADVIGYTICYTTTSGLLLEGAIIPTTGELPTCTDVGLVTIATIPDLQDEIPYYFGVVAQNDIFKSALSNIVESPGFARPAPPLNNRGTSTVNNIDVPLN